eukprot:1253242-Pleurochrysis_carterae.AAC.1
MRLTLAECEAKSISVSAAIEAILANASRSSRRCAAHARPCFAPNLAPSLAPSDAVASRRSLRCLPPCSSSDAACRICTSCQSPHLASAGCARLTRAKFVTAKSAAYCTSSEEVWSGWLASSILEPFETLSAVETGAPASDETSASQLHGVASRSASPFAAEPTRKSASAPPGAPASAQGSAPSPVSLTPPPTPRCVADPRAAPACMWTSLASKCCASGVSCLTMSLGTSSVSSFSVRTTLVAIIRVAMRAPKTRSRAEGSSSNAATSAGSSSSPADTAAAEAEADVPEVSEAVAEVLAAVLAEVLAAVLAAILEAVG